jgi:rod shape-determining protein MreB and related proteins
MFGIHIGIDLGTANTVFATSTHGIILDEPSVIALTTRRGKLSVIAVGSDAKPMLGKTPISIEAHTPLKDGVIANFEVAEKMIDAFFKKAMPSFKFFKPYVIVCVPYGATAVEKRAIQQTLRSAGAKRVGLIEEPMAAALGSNLPVFEPRGSMIVDIGGGTTEIGIISLGGIVCANSIRVGGNYIDRVIVETMRKQCDLIIGLATAERVKMAIVSALSDDCAPCEAEVSGVGSISGAPTSVMANSLHFRAAMSLIVDKLEFEIRKVLEKAPPDLASDVHFDGIVLTGGGALLRGLDVELTKRLGIKVEVAEHPMHSVAFGAGLAASLGAKFAYAIQYDI